MRTLAGHEKRIRSLEFSSDSTHLASGSEDGSIIIWKADTGKEMQNLTGHYGFVTSVAFSKNSELIASGSVDGTIRIWNTDQGTVLQELEIDASIRSISFNDMYIHGPAH